MWIAIFLSVRAWAAPTEIPTETVSAGPVSARLATTPADLVLLYAGEHKGSLETCGCPKRPRGSLARLEAYRKAAGPSVLVNAGYWLEDPTGFDGALKRDTVVMNEWMARGVAVTSWAALNVAAPDIPALVSLDPTLRDGLPLVSASWEGPGIEPFLVVESGGRKVAITGVSAREETLGAPGPYRYRTRKEVLLAVEEIPDDVDVIVVLAWHEEELAQGLARQFPVDVIVSANLHREQLPAKPVGNAVQVSSFYQTMRLGELRLTLAGGTVTGGVDRQIDLDPDLTDDPGVLALQNEARSAINVVQAELYAR